MKLFLTALLTLGSFSVLAKDCSISVKGLETSKKVSKSILESKGYVVTNSNSHFSIQAANYMGPQGESTIVINLFEKDQENRIGHVEKNLSFFSGAKKAEKDFLKSLPSCSN